MPIVLIGWFATRKFGNEKYKAIAKDELVENETQIEVNKMITESKQITLNQQNEIKIEELNGSITQETTEEKLTKLGFVPDPNNTNQLMKKEVSINGKETTMYADKYDAFEPTNKTIKNTLETLEMKSRLNPEDEISNLRPFNMNMQENLMLMGSFRDDDNDLEMFFSPILDENNNSTGQDRICFISPKLKINIQKRHNKAVLRTDDTGYAVVKLDDVSYARFAWSFEKTRILHGDILNFKNGTFVKTYSFAAKELHVLEGETQKYCK